MKDSLKISGCMPSQITAWFRISLCLFFLIIFFFFFAFHKGPGEWLFSVDVVQIEAELNSGWSLSATRHVPCWAFCILLFYFVTNGDDCSSFFDCDYSAFLKTILNVAHIKHYLKKPTKTLSPANRSVGVFIFF